jgi:nitrite reductase (NADH) large subunit
VTGLGIRVSTSLSTTAIRTDGDRVTGVAFRDGSVIDCDFVVVAAGARRAADLARRAGLAICRGIVVDDHLACSGADDVTRRRRAEHRGRCRARRCVNRHGFSPTTDRQNVHASCADRGGRS